MTESRPKTMTPEIAERAAREVATGLIDNDLVDDNLEGVVRDIVKCARRDMDGYEIAKALERDCWWTCDFQIAEELESFSSLVDDEIRKAEKAWAERNNVQPPFPVGTKVKWSEGLDIQTGEITSLYEHGAAQYLIKVDGDPDANESHKRCRIVNFENVMVVELGDPDPASAGVAWLGG